MLEFKTFSTLGKVMWYNLFLSVVSNADLKLLSYQRCTLTQGLRYFNSKDFLNQYLSLNTADFCQSLNDSGAVR